MENQHRKIKGYRELSQAEIDLMNEMARNNSLFNHDEINRLTFAGPKRWASIARTDLQKGFMAATRAIAQPEFF